MAFGTVVKYLVATTTCYVAAVAVLISAQQTWPRLPDLLESKLLWDCSSSDHAPSCLVRMQAVGNLFFRDGRSDRGEFWYRQAALRGDPVAMFHLAWVYEQKAQIAKRQSVQWVGMQVKYHDPPQHIDRRDFFKLTRKLDKRSVVAAKASDGFHRMAESWYRRSADLGFAPSMNNLAMLYSRSTLFSDRADLAREYLKAAHEIGNPIAGWNYLLTYPHEPGLPPIPTDPTQWREWTWTPTEGVRRQLARPILERTFAVAGGFSDTEHHGLRQSAKMGEPVTFKVKPLVSPALASNPEDDLRPDWQ